MANEYVFEDEHFAPKFSAGFLYRGIEEVWVGDGDSATREEDNDKGYLYAKYHDGRIVCAGKVAPELDESVEAAEEAARNAESSASLAQSYKSVAEQKAQIATDEASRSTTGADSATRNANNATQERYKSEGYACGTQDGVEVGQGSPYYQSNAKYYYDIIFERGTEEIVTPAQEAAQAAANSASAAANSASVAANNASAAADSASAAAVYKQDAQDASEAASSSAQSASLNADASQDSLLRAEAMRYESEGYACGTQDGIDADSSSPYYHNNAKYYYDMIAQGGGIPVSIYDLYYYYNWDSRYLVDPGPGQIIVYLVGPFLIGFVDIKMRDDVRDAVSGVVPMFLNDECVFRPDGHPTVTIPIGTWLYGTPRKQIGTAMFMFYEDGHISVSIWRDELSTDVSAFIHGFFVLPLANNS